MSNINWVDSDGNSYILGNVSIGAQVYDYALNVQGNIRAKSTGHADLVADAGAGQNAGLIFRRDGTLRWAMQSVDGDVLYLTRFGGVGYARALTIDNASGYVGIDNPSPAAKLDVNGDIAVNGVVDGVDVSAHAASANAHHLQSHGDSDHTPVYALLAGRSGGQVLIGGTVSGDHLDLQSTSGATKGRVRFHDALNYIDASGNLVLNGNISLVGTVDGVDVSAHAASANAHHNQAHGDSDHTPVYALLAGRSGGQVLIGGTGSGENLTLQSTSHDSKGKIYFHNTDNYIDKDGNLTLKGHITPTTTSESIAVRTGNKTRLSVEASGEIIAYPTDTTDEGGQVRLNGAGSNYYVYVDNYQGRFRVITYNSSQEVERLRVPTSGDVIIYGGGLKFGDSRQAINSDGYALYA